MSILQDLSSQFQHNLTGYVSAALAVTGLAYLTKCSLGLLIAILRIFILSGKSPRKYGPKGSWALVTGASDGIGKEYALQLAQKGFNIVLVSRTESKLLALANEIESKNAEQGIRTKILAMDFARSNDADYQSLAALIDCLDIAILVNNVGLSHDIPTTFLQTSSSAIDDIVTINVLGTLRVTQLVAPGMVQRKRGLILTMGSFGGLMPTPLLATYSGSKAFLQHWSTSLHSELKPHGVEVQLIISYLVTSAMSKIRRPSMTIPTPKTFVRAALSRIGVNVGGLPGTMTPFWAHAVMHWAIENTLGIGSSFLLSINKKMHEDIRTRALRKRERETKKN